MNKKVVGVCCRERETDTHLSNAGQDISSLSSDPSLLPATTVEAFTSTAGQCKDGVYICVWCLWDTQVWECGVDRMFGSEMPLEKPTVGFQRVCVRKFDYVKGFLRLPHTYTPCTVFLPSEMPLDRVELSACPRVGVWDSSTLSSSRCLDPALGNVALLNSTVFILWMKLHHGENAHQHPTTRRNKSFKSSCAVFMTTWKLQSFQLPSRKDSFEQLPSS